MQSGNPNVKLSTLDITYLNAFHAFWARHLDAPELLKKYLTDECPECGENIASSAYPHITFNFDNATKSSPPAKSDFVLIGCEGYHVLNPHLLGISSGWDDWTEYLESDTEIIHPFFD